MNEIHNGFEVTSFPPMTYLSAAVSSHWDGCLRDRDGCIPGGEMAHGSFSESSSLFLFPSTEQWSYSQGQHTGHSDLAPCHAQEELGLPPWQRYRLLANDAESSSYCS